MVCGIICMKSRHRPSLLLKPALLWTAGSPSINRKCLDQFICKRAHILENRRNLGYCAFLCFLLLLLFMDVLRPLPLSALTQRLGQGRSCWESGSKVWWGKVPRLGMAYSIVWCPKGRSGKKKKKGEAGDRARSPGWFFCLRNSHPAVATSVSRVKSNATLSYLVSTLLLCILQSLCTAARVVVFLNHQSDHDFSLLKPSSGFAINLQAL